MDKSVVGLVLFLTCIYLNQIQTAPAPQYKSEISDDGYHFEYSTSDSERSETGKVKEIESEKPIIVTGSYKYRNSNGNTVVEVFYEADENGFHPKVVFSKSKPLDLLRDGPSPPIVQSSAALLASLAG